MWLEVAMATESTKEAPMEASFKEPISALKVEGTS